MFRLVTIPLLLTGLLPTLLLSGCRQEPASDSLSTGGLYAIPAGEWNDKV